MAPFDDYGSWAEDFGIGLKEQKLKAPRSKLQRSSNIQTSKTVTDSALRLCSLRFFWSLVWDLVLLWILDLGAWSFFGAWILVLGAFTLTSNGVLL
jgi:hypothetical protein